MTALIDAAKALAPYTVKIRRQLHEHPELTSREFNTVKLIRAELEAAGIAYHNIPDGGVLGWLDGAKDGTVAVVPGNHPVAPQARGQAVLLRADCDALPIQESEYNAKQKKLCVSQVPGVAHACGHDSHVAMLLTAAKLLKAREKDFSGRVYFLFERGEEGGNCIYYVMRYLQMEHVRVDAAYALHSDVHYPAGFLAGQKGPANSGNINFEIRLHGKDGHGSRPDLANNPIDCFLAIATALKDIRMRHIDPSKPIILNIGAVHAGTKRNIIAEELTLLGTSRFHHRESGRVMKAEMRKIIDNIAAAYDCAPDYVEFTGPSFPLYNEPETTELGMEALRALVGKERFIENREVGMGSESFATVAAYIPSSFFRVGMRNEEMGITVGGHQAKHDLDEAGFPYGAAAYAALALNYLAQPRAYPAGFTPFEGTADDFLKETGRPVPKRYDAPEA